MKKGESTYCHKGQVLAQVGQHKTDVKLISTLHTAYIVEKEKKNLNDETMKKPQKIQDHTKFMCGMDRQTKVCTITHAAQKL